MFTLPEGLRFFYQRGAAKLSGSHGGCRPLGGLRAGPGDAEETLFIALNPLVCMDSISPFCPWFLHGFHLAQWALDCILPFCSWLPSWIPLCPVVLFSSWIPFRPFVLGFLYDPFCPMGLGLHFALLLLVSFMDSTLPFCPWFPL